jgi:hypothetical protein
MKNIFHLENSDFTKKIDRTVGLHQKNHWVKVSKSQNVEGVL